MAWGQSPIRSTTSSPGTPREARASWRLVRTSSLAIEPIDAIDHVDGARRRLAPDEPGDDPGEGGRRGGRSPGGVGDGCVDRGRLTDRLSIGGADDRHRCRPAQGAVAVGARGGLVPRRPVAATLDRGDHGPARRAEAGQAADQQLGQCLRRPPAVVEPGLARRHERLRLGTHPSTRTAALTGGVARSQPEHDAGEAIRRHRRRGGLDARVDVVDQSTSLQRSHRARSERCRHLTFCLHHPPFQFRSLRQ